MRKPAKRGTRQQKSQTRTLSAPVNGWNTKDSLAQMGPLYAVSVRNYFPSPSDVMVRKGSQSWGTGFTHPVNSVIPYNGLTVRKLFAASNDKIYDVTSSGAIGAGVVTSLTSDKFQHTQISNAGNVYLVICNGADSVRNYDGTNWTTPSISGVTSANLINVNTFKERLFFVEKNTLNAWYLPTQSIAGTASKLDFGSVFKRGGKLVAMASWTIDGGTGLDDYAAWITDQGEVAIYQGTDPSSATTWALQGVYFLSPPLGYRCFTKYGGDVLVITKNGLLPLSKSLMSATIDNASAVTDNIRPTISESATSYASNFGWQCLIYSSENMLILNVPVGTGRQEQYVMNTINGAWGRFTDLNANCWAFFGDEIYFGGATKVYKAWTGNKDDSANINAEMMQAFNYFGNHSQLKQFKLGRCTFSTSGTPSIAIGVNIDFDLLSAPNLIPVNTPSNSVWDTAIWDRDVWGGSSAIVSDWNQLMGIGYCASMHIKTQSSNDLRWISSDFLMESGGVI